jgi:hypothetical protein
MLERGFRLGWHAWVLGYSFFVLSRAVQCCTGSRPPVGAERGPGFTNSHKQQLQTADWGLSGSVVCGIVGQVRTCMCCLCWVWCLVFTLAAHAALACLAWHCFVQSSLQRECVNQSCTVPGVLCSAATSVLYRSAARMPCCVHCCPSLMATLCALLPWFCYDKSAIYMSTGQGTAWSGYTG